MFYCISLSSQNSNLATRGTINSNSFSSSYGTFESGFTNIVFTHEFASFNMRFEPNKSIPGWTTIATIPGGIKPRYGVSICAGEGNTMRTVVRIITNGAIMVESALSSGQSIECNVCFFINW